MSGTIGSDLSAAGKTDDPGKGGVGLLTVLSKEFSHLLIMYEIDIQREFSAAHTLKGYNGNCSALHGHNWTVQVIVSSPVLDDIGIAVDFRALKKELDIIITELDHTNLNEVAPFTKDNPTSEQLARYIFNRLSEKLNTENITVSKIRVCESPGSGATYFK